ncbi:hypothetical protein [Ornithinimicrobium panacihumi]|uniref:hypothetical protein n=1 Tax=Ornithinimicrobium panacihumi TaxID=2008449 RepID=UPI003F8A5785
MTSLLLLTLTLSLVWFLLCIDKIATPRIDEVQEVDAVYVIGPVETRIDEVLATMDSGVAPVLLATTSINQSTGEPYATGHCGEERKGYRVECVLPDPYTTRGEARLLGEKIEENGWERVAVMTSTPHAARTRLLMERCTDAEVLVWTVHDGKRSWSGWASAFVYQSAAWAKAQIERDC